MGTRFAVKVVAGAEARLEGCKSSCSSEPLVGDVGRLASTNSQ
jgi:hypothetical protein